MTSDWNLKVLLNKISSNYEMNTWYIYSISNCLKKIGKIFITVILPIATLWFAYKAVNLQESAEKQQNFPFFQYEYSDGIFRVTGDTRVAITKVDWVLLAKFGHEKWELHSVNQLPTDLNYKDLFEFFAREIGANPFTQKNKVDCSWYLFNDLGIPALVSITYDQNEKQGLTSKDFVLITRLDTKIPKIIVPTGGRNVQDSDIARLFNKDIEWYAKTLDLMKENQVARENNGICDLLVGQPIGGY